MQRFIRLRGPAQSCQLMRAYPTLAFRLFRTSSVFANQKGDDIADRIKMQPIKRTGEDLETKRARLIYQSRKRGILETDLLLSGFAAKYLKTMSAEELEEYDELLNELDWDIYYWATRNYSITPLPKKWENSSILKKLQLHSENKDKNILRMPDLAEF